MIVCISAKEEACASADDPTSPSTGEGLSLLQVKADKITSPDSGRAVHGKGRVFGGIEKVDTVEAQDSESGCSCTWNAAYPCSLHGTCYSYSTSSTCRHHGGQFCGSSSSSGGSCSCTWSSSYRCSLHGSCYSYSTHSSCHAAGGQFCGGSGPSPPPPPPPSPPSYSGGSVSGWKEAVLAQTNKYRAQHRAPALTWDNSLAQQGQNWANRCVFEHSSMGNGENLWAGSGGFNGASAVTSWYDEIKDYNWNYPGFSMSTGHFTQLVWKSTTKVGCGLKKCSSMMGMSNAYFLVCEYSPPGNYQGEFPSNVLQ